MSSGAAFHPGTPPDGGAAARSGPGPEREKVAIVVSHGTLATGLVSAMETVLGPQANVFPLSNSGKSPAALEGEIEALIARLPAGSDVYLLSDVQGGSCATTCLRAARRMGVRGVFYGTNLTLLLEFILHRELPREAFFQALLSKSRSAVSGVTLDPESAPAAAR